MAYNENEIIRILFGVKGGGSVGGESGELIKKDLHAIAKEISDQKLLTVKFNVDTEHISKQLKKINLDINSIVKNSKINTDGITSTTKTTSSSTTKEIADNNKIQKQIESKIRSYAKLTANIEEWNQRYGKIVSTNQQVHQGLENVLASARELPKSNVEDLDKQYNNLRFSFDKLRSSAYQTGAMALTMGQKFKKAIESKAFNNLAVLLLGVVTRAFRQVYQNVVKLDASMTQLRIVTRASDKAYEDFSKSVASSAKRIGASIKDLIESTTEFARLGYDLKEAQIFAELTTIYSRVAAVPIGEATNSITAVIKAYNVQAEQLEKVLDLFIYAADGYAISADEIGTAMNNAASALAANGNSIAEAVGILTAANTTLQNINVSSTAVRTMSARIARSSNELTALGEDIGNVLTTARLDKQMQQFGVAIVDANGDLRSTYNILADLNDKWTDLNGVQRAAIAEMIAGKLVPVRTEMCA